MKNKIIFLVTVSLLNFSNLIWSSQLDMHRMSKDNEKSPLLEQDDEGSDFLSVEGVHQTGQKRFGFSKFSKYCGLINIKALSDGGTLVTYPKSRIIRYASGYRKVEQNGKILFLDPQGNIIRSLPDQKKLSKKSNQGCQVS